jgi:glycosyltransferase involved in cell wall biosynthesis
MLRARYGSFYLHSIRSVFVTIAKRVQPDVVYATWAYPDCYAAVRAAAPLGIPVVSRLHGSDINDYLQITDRKPLILEAMRRSAAIVSVSEDLKRTLLAEGIDGGKIHVVYNGVDRDVFHPMDRCDARRRLGLSDRAEIVLFAGNLKPVKRVDLLIGALARLERKGLELHVLGDGPERSRLERLAAQLQVGPRVRFHGTVPHRSLGLWFNACDVFCLPSRNEGTPNVLLESLACGTPAVASDTGGIPEILSEDSGLRFPPESVDGLVESLRAGLTRNWERSRIVSPAGSWEQNAAAVGEVLSRAAGTSSRTIVE